MSDDKTTKEEVAMVVASNEQQVLIVRGTKETPTEMQLLNKVQEGRPIHGDLVHLRQREDAFYNISQTQIPRLSGVRSSSGPAQVASTAYRANYEQIFSSNKELN